MNGGSVVIPALTRWGLSAHADLVYRTLTGGSWSTAHLARQLGVAPHTVKRACDELVACGAVRYAGSAGGERIWRAMPVDHVLDRLSRRTGATAQAARPAPAKMVIHDRCPAAAAQPLTPRERAVVRSLLAGHTDATIARMLGVSARTVQYTIRSLMDRLGVTTRFALGHALGRLGHDFPADRPPPS
jgi:DNA-binding CsgD family transcriptional regulator